MQSQSQPQFGDDHRPCVQDDLRRAEKLLPQVHRVFGTLKTWLLGTHYGVGFHAYWSDALPRAVSLGVSPIGRTVVSPTVAMRSGLRICYSRVLGPSTPRGRMRKIPSMEDGLSSSSSPTSSSQSFSSGRGSVDGIGISSPGESRETNHDRIVRYHATRSGSASSSDTRGW